MAAGVVAWLGPLPWLAVVALPVTAVVVFWVSSRGVQAKSEPPLRTVSVFELVSKHAQHVPAGDSARSTADEALRLAARHDDLAKERELEILRKEPGPGRVDSERRLRVIISHAATFVDDYQNDVAALNSVANWDVLVHRLGNMCTWLADELRT